jgi:hypothetical protein
MSVGINYRRKYSVGNSVAFLRFSGSVISKIKFRLANWKLRASSIYWWKGLLD